MSISALGSGAYSGVSTLGAGFTAPSTKPARDSAAELEFKAWAAMTPAQRMRANILASMGLTEDQVQAMGAKERAALEDKIKDQIKEMVKKDAEKKTGLLVDVKV